MDEFVPLWDALAGHFGKKRADLPKELEGRMRHEPGNGQILHSIWDGMSPEQRETLITPLVIALKGHFDKKLADLPKNLRDRIHNEMGFRSDADWDDRTPSQREEATRPRGVVPTLPETEAVWPLGMRHKELAPNEGSTDEFVPLLDALAGHFKTPHADLPKNLKDRIWNEMGFRPSDWDNRTPEQREEWARQAAIPLDAALHEHFDKALADLPENLRDRVRRECGLEFYSIWDDRTPEQRRAWVAWLTKGGQKEPDKSHLEYLAGFHGFPTSAIAITIDGKSAVEALFKIAPKRTANWPKSVRLNADAVETCILTEDEAKSYSTLDEALRKTKHPLREWLRRASARGIQYSPALDLALERYESPVMEQTSTAGQEGAQKRPLFQQPFQEQEILRVIRGLGHDPKALPDRVPGKGGVKAEVRRQLNWTGTTTFDKAWDRLRASGEIKGG